MPHIDFYPYAYIIYIMNTQKVRQNKSFPNQNKNSRAPLIATAVLSFIAGVAIFLVLATTSLENILLAMSTNGANGKVYATTSCRSSLCEAETENVLAKHHGKPLGDLKLYQDTNFSGYYYVISLSAVSNLLTTELAAVPNDKIPAFVPSTTNPTELPQEFFTVGSYSPITPEQLQEIHAGVFAPAISQLSPTYAPAVYLVDDGSQKIEKFLEAQKITDPKQLTNPSANLDDFLDSTKLVVAFDNYHDAIAYQEDLHQIGHVSVEDLFSNTLDIRRAFSLIYIFSTKVLCALTAVTVLVIMLISTINQRKSAK